MRAQRGKNELDTNWNIEVKNSICNFSNLQRSGGKMRSEVTYSNSIPTTIFERFN